MKKDINSVWKKFEDNNVSHSATHYLLSISELLERNGYARMIDISKKLGITPGSCSTGLKSLIKRGLIQEDENKFLKLTKKGSDIVLQVIQNREVLVSFFTKVLGVSEEQAIINACKVEHLIAPEIILKIKKLYS